MMQNLVLYNQRIYDRETLFQWFLSQQKFCDCNNWDRGKHKERKKMVIQQHIQIAELPQPFETCVSVGQQEQWLKVGFAKTPLNGSSWMHPVFGGCVSHWLDWPQIWKPFGTGTSVISYRLMYQLSACLFVFSFTCTSAQQQVLGLHLWGWLSWVPFLTSSDTSPVEVRESPTHSYKSRFRLKQHLFISIFKCSPDSHVNLFADIHLHQCLVSKISSATLLPWWLDNSLSLFAWRWLFNQRRN